MLRSTFLKRSGGVILALAGLRLASPKQAPAALQARPWTFEIALAGRGRPLVPGRNVFGFLIPDLGGDYYWDHVSGWIEAPSSKDVQYIFRHYGPESHNVAKGFYTFGIPAGKKSYAFTVRQGRELRPLRAGDTIAIDIDGAAKDATGGRLRITLAPA